MPTSPPQNTDALTSKEATELYQRIAEGQKAAYKAGFLAGFQRGFEKACEAAGVKPPVIDKAGLV